VPQKLISRVNLEDYRLSKGPNGHSLVNALADIRGMPDSLIQSLKAMNLPIGHTVSSLKENIDLHISFFDKEVRKVAKTSYIRRLSSFPDKEGKMRTIGIIDYFSQLALKPLHNYLGQALSKIPQDCTLDQQKFKKLLDGAEIYYSIDLSNATDRFPISVIKSLLECQLPRSYVDAWSDVMVGYPFNFEGKDLFYAVGNPMGAYSSFNSFALTHHFLIYHCCRKLGIK